MEKEKLTSVLAWVNDEGIFPSDAEGNPIESELVEFDKIQPNWFSNLSIQDKLIVKAYINIKNKK